MQKKILKKRIISRTRLLKIKSCLCFFICIFIVITKFFSNYNLLDIYADSVIDYTADDVGDITIGDIVISLQNASYGTITDTSYINAVKNTMSGNGQNIDYVMSLDEQSAKQYLQVVINNAENNGAVGLNNQLEIDQNKADYLNAYFDTSDIGTSSAADNLYATIKDTYNTNNDLINNDKGSWSAILAPSIDAVQWGSKQLARASLVSMTYAVIEDWGNNIKNGTNVNTNQILYQYPSGYNKFLIKEEGRYDPIIYGDDYTIFCAVKDADRYDYYACNIGSGKRTIMIKKFDGDTRQFTSSVNTHQFTNYYSITNYTKMENMSGYIIYFNTIQDMESYLNNIRNGTENKPLPYSPDIVNSNGNANYNPDNNEYNFNQNLINYDPDTQVFSPININSESYGNYIDSLNNNTQNNNYSDNSQVFNNYITNNYITNAPVVPTPTPDISPDIPVQPTGIPAFPTLTPQQEEENKSIMMPELSNWKSKFPFCIPFDLLLMMQLFQGTKAREAPVIDWDLSIVGVGTWHIYLDFSVWDDAALLLRTLQLILFIALLMHGARAWIKI